MEIRVSGDFVNIDGKNVNTIELTNSGNFLCQMDYNC